jgi:hypothetical protein
MTQLPNKGELWYYDPRNGIPSTYLILEAEYRDTGSTVIERKYVADLLCLDNGEHYPDYPWPDHTWKRVG